MGVFWDSTVWFYELFFCEVYEVALSQMSDSDGQVRQIALWNFGATLRLHPSLINHFMESLLLSSDEERDVLLCNASTMPWHRPRNFFNCASFSGDASLALCSAFSRPFRKFSIFWWRSLFSKAFFSDCTINHKLKKEILENEVMKFGVGKETRW